MPIDPRLVAAISLALEAFQLEQEQSRPLAVGTMNIERINPWRNQGRLDLMRKPQQPRSRRNHK